MIIYGSKRRESGVRAEAKHFLPLSLRLPWARSREGQFINLGGPHSMLNCLVVSVLNCQPDISLHEFQRHIATTYLQQAEQRIQSGTPPHSANVISDVRYDKYEHYVVPLGKQAWKCAVKECKFRPSQGCVKCNVHLCVKCFLSYHTQN